MDGCVGKIRNGRGLEEDIMVVDIVFFIIFFVMFFVIIDFIGFMLIFIVFMSGMFV